jgi:hypothetical protein
LGGDRLCLRIRVHSLIVTDHSIIGPWVADKTNGPYDPINSTSIGWVKDRILAGVTYYSYTKKNVFAAVAVDTHYLPKEFLNYIFYYPFVQCGCSRITVTISSANIKSLRFTEKLGFKKEASLEDADEHGDLILMRLFKHEAKYGKTISPPGP